MPNQINHVRRGSGPPLLLVHGIGDRWQTWTPVLDRVAAERDVVALDVPGFGASPPLAATPTLEALADAVSAFAADLGLERPHVAGNSMGGGIAIELARRGTVASATALSPIGFWSRREVAYARAILRMTIASTRRFGARMAPLARSAAGRKLLLGHVFGHPERIPPDVVVESLDALAASRFDETLEQISGWIPTGRPQVPTTIAWAEHDRLLLPRQARRARRAWPEARHVTLTGCGHVPCWDDPEQVAEVLLKGSG